MLGLRDEHLFTDLSAAAVASISSWTVSHALNAMHSYSQLGYDDPKLLDALIAHVTSRLGKMTPSEFVNASCAFAEVLPSCVHAKKEATNTCTFLSRLCTCRCDSGGLALAYNLCKKVEDCKQRPRYGFLNDLNMSQSVNLLNSVIDFGACWHTGSLKYGRDDFLHGHDIHEPAILAESRAHALEILIARISAMSAEECDARCLSALAFCLGKLRASDSTLWLRALRTLNDKGFIGVPDGKAIARVVYALGRLGITVTAPALRETLRGGQLHDAIYLDRGMVTSEALTMLAWGLASLSLRWQQSIGSLVIASIVDKSLAVRSNHNGVERVCAFRNEDLGYFVWAIGNLSPLEESSRNDHAAGGSVPRMYRALISWASEEWVLGNMGAENIAHLLQGLCRARVLSPFALLEKCAIRLSLREVCMRMGPISAVAVLEAYAGFECLDARVLTTVSEAILRPRALWALPAEDLVLLAESIARMALVTADEHQQQLNQASQHHFRPAAAPIILIRACERDTRDAIARRLDQGVWSNVRSDRDATEDETEALRWVYPGPGTDTQTEPRVDDRDRENGSGTESRIPRDLEPHTADTVHRNVAHRHSQAEQDALAGADSPSSSRDTGIISAHQVQRPRSAWRNILGTGDVNIVDRYPATGPVEANLRDPDDQNNVYHPYISSTRVSFERAPATHVSTDGYVSRDEARGILRRLMCAVGGHVIDYDPAHQFITALQSVRIAVAFAKIGMRHNDALRTLGSRIGTHSTHLDIETLIDAAWAFSVLDFPQNHVFAGIRTRLLHRTGGMVQVNEQNQRPRNMVDDMNMLQLGHLVACFAR